MKLARREAVLVICFLLHAVSETDGREYETPPSIPPDSGGIIYSDNDSVVPKTAFNCHGRNEGHYGDKNYGCAVFHYCSKSGKKYSYKCKEGKKFDELSSSCIYYLGEGCKSSSNEDDENKRGSRDSEGKFSFYSFSQLPTKQTIEDTLIPSEGLDALAAFASLARTDQKNSFSTFQTDALKSSGNSESNYPKQTLQATKNDAHNYFQSNQHTQFHSLEPTYEQSYDDIHDDSVDRNSQVSDTEYYEGINRDLNKASNQPHETNSYSFFPPTTHVQNAFNTVRETVNAPVFNFASSQARQNSQTLTNTVKENKNPPISHVHFTPPGFRTSPLHSLSNGKKVNGNIPSFHGILSPKSPAPPSVFGSPSPKTIDSSSPSLKDIYRSGYEKDEYSTPHYFDYYSGYKPLSTPAYYDDINYDITGYYNSPVDFSNPKYNSPVYTHNLNPNTERYLLATPKTGPQSPLSSALRVQNPHTFIKHTNYVRSNIKTSIPIDENSHHELPNILRGHNFVNTPITQSHFVTKNPIVHVSTISPNLRHPSSFVEPTHVFHDSVIDEPIQNYPTPSPPFQGGFDTSAVHRPSRQKSSLVHNKEIDITTYSPKYIPKIIENIVEVEEELEEKPKKRINAARLPIVRQRPNKRPTPSSKIRSSTVVEKLDPSTDQVEEKESYEVLIEDEEPDEVAIQNIVNHPATMIIPSTTPKIKSTQSAKPTRPSLNGSLKERLNRLGTRRRTLNQSTKSQTTELESGTREIINTPIPKRKIPLKRPVSKNEAQIENTEEISPSDEKKLKGRITNYFKDGTTSRNRNSPRRAPLRRKTAKDQAGNNIENKEDDSIVINQQKENDPEKIDEVTYTISENNEGSYPNNDASIASGAPGLEEHSDESAINKDKLSEDVISTSVVSETYDDSPIEEDNDKTAESTQEIKASRKRTMNPDVRARFKEFLKNRRNGSNNKKRLRQQQVKETIETDNRIKNKNEDSRKKAGTPSENETDNTVNESEIFEESIPLIREEKIVVLPKEPKNISKNEIKLKNKSNFNLRENLAGSGVISSKPLRYELSKIDKTTVINSDVTEIPTSTVRVINYNDNKYARRKFPTKPGKLAPPSITTHTVVRPDYKQIVKMSPRHPELISPTIDKLSSTTESESIIVKAVSENYEVDSTIKGSVPQNNNKFKNGDADVHVLESVTPSEFENHHVREFILREKPVIDRLSDSFEHPIFDSVKEVIGNSKGSHHPEVRNYKEKTKPVFNLDTIYNAHKVTTDDSHISVIDSKFQSGQTSAVNFEPFPIESDSPFLPIELLLRVT